MPAVVATDTYYASGPMIEPGKKCFAITKSDTDQLAVKTRAIFIGTGGNISVILADDSAPVVFKNIPDGTLLPLRVKQVYSTNTTASDMVGIY